MYNRKEWMMEIIVKGKITLITQLGIKFKLISLHRKIKL